MSVLNDNLIKKIKGIEIKAKHLVNSSFAGEYRSTFKGRGIEFDEVRKYELGDDIKSIDWNVTARHASPFVKIFKDERELTIMLIVDLSASHLFGSKIAKNEMAAEISALIAYVALVNNDKVGLIIFSDRIEHYIPPKRGRGHVFQVIRDILTFEAVGRKTNFNLPLQFLSQVIKKRSITFLLSDFQDSISMHRLKMVARMHEMIALALVDPLELQLPPWGFIDLQNIESNERVLIKSDRAFGKRYKKLTGDRLDRLENLFRSSTVDFLLLNSGKAYLDQLIHFFKKRGSHVGK